MVTETNIKKILQSALDLGASYADIRVKDILKEHLCYENGVLTDASKKRSHGYGVRVYVDGSMGFAASNNFEQMEDTVKNAYEIALASRTLQSQRITLTEKSTTQESYKSNNPASTFLADTRKCRTSDRAGSRTWERSCFCRQELPRA
jgi:TldD protein